MYRVSRDLSDKASLDALPEVQVPHMLREQFTGLTTGLVKLYFFDYIGRVQAKGKIYDRVAILTKDQLVVASLDGRVKRCIWAEDITGIAFEKTGSKVLLQIPSEYNLLLKVIRARDQFVRAVSAVSGAQVSLREGEIRPSADLVCPKGRVKNITFRVSGPPPSSATSGVASNSSASDSRSPVRAVANVNKVPISVYLSSQSSSSSSGEGVLRRWSCGDEREVQMRSDGKGWEEEIVWVRCTVISVDDVQCTSDVRLHLTPCRTTTHFSIADDVVTAVDNHNIREAQTPKGCLPACWCKSQCSASPNTAAVNSLFQIADTHVPEALLPRKEPPKGNEIAQVDEEKTKETSKVTTAKPRELNCKVVENANVPALSAYSEASVKTGSLVASPTSSLIQQGRASVSSTSVRLPLCSPVRVTKTPSVQSLFPGVVPLGSPIYNSDVSVTTSPRTPLLFGHQTSTPCSVALYDFTARSGDEVSVLRGDALASAHNKAPDAGWCTVTNIRTSKTGYIPESYLSKPHITPFVSL